MSCSGASGATQRAASTATSSESVLPSASAKNSAPFPETSAILEGKRKAIKAALKAGVKPTQVARHFGVSLAEVRKVASQGRLVDPGVCLGEHGAGAATCAGRRWNGAGSQGLLTEFFRAGRGGAFLGWHQDSD
jgi:hypothetical protein